MSLSDERPLVSILVPAFNAEATLGRTLESLRGQSLEDFEVLVVDDASEDATMALLEDWREPRLRWWRFDQNRGPSAARNFAFEQSRGRYAALLDADDWWSPEKLETQVAALSRRPEAVLAYSWTRHVDLDRDESGVAGEAGPARSVGFRPDFEGDVLPTLVLGNFLESGSNPLIRRRAWRAAGGFDEDLRHCEDWDFYLRLAALGPFVVAPGVHVFYRRRPNSLSRDVASMESAARSLILRSTGGEMTDARSYRRASLGNLYKYLVFQFCGSAPKRGQRLLGLRFLLAALRNDPALLRGTAWIRSLRAVLRHLAFPRQIEGRLAGHGALLDSIRWTPVPSGDRA